MINSVSDTGVIKEHPKGLGGMVEGLAGVSVPKLQAQKN